MDRRWDAVDEWSGRHPAMFWLFFPLLIPLAIIDTLLNGPRRNGYPPCKSMSVDDGYEHLTELEKSWWRCEQRGLI